MIKALGIFLLGLIPALPSWGESGKPYHWYDGDRKRALGLESDLVAEFDTGGLDRSALKSEYPQSTLQSTHGRFTRIWKTGQNARAGAVVSQMKVSHPDKNISPVFKDGPQRKALPGNILVTLDPKWTADQRQQWVDRHGFTVVRSISQMPNVLVIKTAAGLEALERANALYESGEVVAASPDWWEGKVHK